jgi:UDP-N-acetylmuramyl pentapeptide phosphotransferase/UDP-N-acetylglucosamine-1-phosphate transferase
LQTVAPVLLAFTATALTIWSMLRFGRAGPLDQPNHRSLHAVPVPRSGGLGILVGLAAAQSLAPLAGPVLVATAGLAALSWLDDRHALPVGLRFVGHFVAAGSIIGFGATPNWGVGYWSLIILTVVWMTNLYNFMDGANGLSGGMTLFGFGTYAWAALAAGDQQFAAINFAIAAAAAAFLIFNFDPARIFMGDVGSIPLGFLAAALGLQGIASGLWPVWFPLLAFSVFIVDATVTLCRRALRRERVWEAHRQHAYQRLVRAGWSHRRLALSAYPLMALTGASAYMMRDAGIQLQCVTLGAWAGVFLIVLVWIEHRIPATPEQPNEPKSPAP